jgi:hypothetical protein
MIIEVERLRVIAEQHARARRFGPVETEVFLGLVESLIADVKTLRAERVKPPEPDDDDAEP